MITQSLLQTADGQGRVAALEILLPDDAVRNLIRQGKVEQIYSVMQTNTARGMQTMEQSLLELVSRRVVGYETALSVTSKPDQLRDCSSAPALPIRPGRSRCRPSTATARSPAACAWPGADHGRLEEGDQAREAGHRSACRDAAPRRRRREARAEKKVPFWKKEIGRSRKPATEAPLQRNPSGASEPVDAEAEAALDLSGYGWSTAGLDQETTDLRSWAESTLAEVQAEIQAEVARRGRG